MNESSYKEVIIPEQFILMALACGNSKFVLKICYSLVFFIHLRTFLALVRCKRMIRC